MSRSAMSRSPMSGSIVLPSLFLAPEVRPEGAAVDAESILTRAEATLLSLFSDQIVSLIAGCPGAAKPAIDPTLPPAQDPIVLLVTRAPIPRDELEAARAEISGPRTHGEGVEILQTLRRDLNRLPAHPRLIDLAAGHRTLAGEPVSLSARPQPERIPLVEGEKLLREGLAGLLEGFPEGAEEPASLRSTSRAVLAAADAFLILKKRYATRLDEKRERFAQFDGTGGVLDLFDAAVSAKVRGEAPPGWSAGRFWGASLHFFLDILLAFLVPAGPPRTERLEILLAGYAVRSVSLRVAARRLARALFFIHRKGKRERLLLALAIARDWEAPRPAIEPLARRAGIAEPRGLSWSDLRERALAEWRGERAPAR